MAKQNNSLWIVISLVVVGGVVLFLSFKPIDSSSQKALVGEAVEQKSVVAVAASADKDPVPSPAIVTSPEHGKEAGFAVQVYSFKDQNRANVALTNLKNSGYNTAYVEISDLGEKGTWYRVRIGSLANETEAKALLETIRKNFNSGIIVKPKV